MKEDCRTCVFCVWVEEEAEDGGNSGWGCEKRDVEHFKRFPSRKRLSCFEVSSFYKGMMDDDMVR